MRYLVNGGDAFSLQKILAQTSLEMTRKYVKMAFGDVKEKHRQFSPMDNLHLRQVCLIRRETMKKLLTTQADLARRVSHLITLVEDLSLRSVEARLARLLPGNAAKDYIPRQRWATQVEIASRLGTAPEVVSRTMRKLAERGLFEISRQAILVTDREGLEMIAQIET